MPKKLTFALPATQATYAEWADNKDAVERELKRARKLFKRGDIVPERIWVPANTILAEESRAMSFDTKRSIVECQREILHRKPHLTLGAGPYMRDKEFSGIEFIEEGDRDDAA